MTDADVVLVIGIVGWHAAPCPFCGVGEPHLRMEFIGDGLTGRIACEECQTCGPVETIDGEDENEMPHPSSNIVTKAIALWNMRGRER